ncbi:MAG: DUF2934 domain-containing protein [Bryobacteraceae bacterium]
MATRKQTTPESGTLKPEETVQTAPKAAVKTVRARKAASERAPGGPETLPAKANSPAATHKAPARKPHVEETIEAHAVETPSFDAAPRHDEISREAYSNWLRRGCPHGSPQEDWLAAVALLRARRGR